MILQETIRPRFSETDALGHINNTVVPVWFEQARRPLFQLFTPDLDPKKWSLIVARVEIDFLGELLYGQDVVVRTSVAKIGNSSFHIAQEILQQGKIQARGVAILVHYDYQLRQSRSIPAEIRQQLEQYLVSS
uniref:Thioesterase family protein n=1 Tax=Roseihalotalea indica TaxID=2867963 RepID=A0AA49GPQ6_9BACT|nr:thioesterase family protein [Tunicatimonas sp. TK19036]